MIMFHKTEVTSLNRLYPSCADTSKERKKKNPGKTIDMNMEMEQNESKYFTTAITQKQSRSTYKPTRNIFYREKQKMHPINLLTRFHY